MAEIRLAHFFTYNMLINNTSFFTSVIDLIVKLISLPMMSRVYSIKLS